ncbi:unnamed protein product [Phyllotreta striolata]|uniref:Uncharacterized protein n=1 Tax=Phyllotreta striolata TaxID=444603 RepID=A0A9N9TS71_PHYSR|nr:unnamed protein product [Phyllotreta striolata]
MKVTVFSTVTVLLCCALGTESFIVPDELPSLLSVIYSNIPTLKKGTDSRLGWGFRLGDRADFQVLVELGPQMYTRPLANQGTDNSANKRSTLENLANTLYAQNQEIKRLKLEQQKLEKTNKEEKKETQKKPIKPEIKQNPSPEAAEWLKNWSLLAKNDVKQSVIKPKPGLGIGEIDAKSVIPPEEDDEDIEEIKVEISNPSGVSTMKPKLTTSKEDALDNVDLD